METLLTKHQYGSLKDAVRGDRGLCDELQPSHDRGTVWVVMLVINSTHVNGTMPDTDS